MCRCGNLPTHFLPFSLSWKPVLHWQVYVFCSGTSTHCPLGHAWSPKRKHSVCESGFIIAVPQDLSNSAETKQNGQLKIATLRCLIIHFFPSISISFFIVNCNWFTFSCIGIVTSVPYVNKLTSSNSSTSFRVMVRTNCSKAFTQSFLSTSDSDTAALSSAYKLTQWCSTHSTFNCSIAATRKVSYEKKIMVFDYLVFHFCNNPTFQD